MLGMRIVNGWSVNWVVPSESLPCRWEEGDGEVQGSTLCIFLKVILGCFTGYESLFSLLICAGQQHLLFFLCNPIADYPIKSWHIRLLLKDTFTTAGNSHQFSGRAITDVRSPRNVRGKHKAKDMPRPCRLEGCWEGGVFITALEALCRQYYLSWCCSFPTLDYF